LETRARRPESALDRAGRIEQDAPFARGRSRDRGNELSLGTGGCPPTRGQGEIGGTRFPSEGVGVLRRVAGGDRGNGLSLGRGRGPPRWGRGEDRGNGVSLGRGRGPPTWDLGEDRGNGVSLEREGVPRSRDGDGERGKVRSREREGVPTMWGRGDDRGKSASPDFARVCRRAEHDSPKAGVGHVAESRSAT
jgi:hypothetical protein